MLNKEEKIQVFKEIENKIQKAENIVIFHHIRPDGDCLGSQFGFKELIKANFPDKKVYTIGDPKGLFPYLNLDFEELKKEKLPNSLAIIVDANFKERIECREYLDNNYFDEVIRIDHHPNDDDLNASLVWVEKESPAAAQQVAEIAIWLNWKITPRAATMLFLGIYTDSVRLTTNLTNERTMSIVSKLWDAGCQKDLIFENMAKKSLSDIRIDAFIQSNMKIEDKVVSFYFDLEQQRKLGITDPLKANRPYTLANIDDNKIWVFFTQESDDPTHIRCEFRSNGACVRNVALKWGGGGHHRASGAVLNDEKLINSVIEDCKKEVLNLKDYDNL
ncbi:DHH family phosphoesterase [[Mycoplasma] gypis]|uniref:Bifunctional oligoribonuclease/PAP phosphatase NrnA n=1 Tax=[Mycoplasma] gypis TaxID=92404 RepID=A0ABZ2RN78_9BACT|nr:bifunctional oligoribonuclease/PAP phosphatase NrnA [[Mycoplasma] gypis]MBN0919649.1 bifunctional oligoribonuclease/PAP phosphatase NrnA [[Mycoplasma] gypis]